MGVNKTREKDETNSSFILFVLEPCSYTALASANFYKLHEPNGTCSDNKYAEHQIQKRPLIDYASYTKKITITAIGIDPRYAIADGIAIWVGTHEHIHEFK